MKRDAGPPVAFRAASLAVATVVLAVGAIGVGCTRRPAATDADVPRVVWPPPPDTPRIEYLQSFSVPEDLGIRAGRFRRFVTRLIRGKSSHPMSRPFAVAVSPDGLIAVADPDARSVHLFDIDRKAYRRILEAAERPLVSPVGVAFDGDGRLYVSDSVRAEIVRFDAGGRWEATVGAEDGLLRPTGLAYDRGRGVLYVVDTLGHRVLGYDDDGQRVLEAGGRGTGNGEFNFPVGIALHPSGRLYVTDSMNFRVQVLDPSGGFVRAFGRHGKGPGDFDKCKGIALDRDGHVYVVEGLHDVIHVYDAEGRLLTVVGGTGAGRGQFVLPAGIHIDDRNRILIADSANRRVQVLRYLGDPSEPQGPS